MKYVCWTQQDRSDCGIACLGSILHYYGENVSLIQLRSLAGTDQSGTTLYGLQVAAQALGFNAEGVRVSQSYLNELKTPAVAHQKISRGNEHYVVIVEVLRSYIRVMDPARGRLIKVKKRDFFRHWQGVLLLVSSEERRTKQKIRRFDFESLNDSLSRLGLDYVRLWGVPFGILAVLVLGFLGFPAKLPISKGITETFGLSFILLFTTCMDLVFGFLHKNQARKVLRVEIQEYKRLARILLRHPRKLVDSWEIHELANRFDDIKECHAYMKERALLVPKNCFILCLSMFFLMITLNHLVIPYVGLCSVALITAVFIQISNGMSALRKDGLRQSLSAFVMKQPSPHLKKSWRVFIAHLGELERQLDLLHEVVAFRNLLLSLMSLVLLVLLCLFEGGISSGLPAILPLFMLVLWSTIRIREVCLHLFRTKSYTIRRKRWEDLRVKLQKTL